MKKIAFGLSCAVLAVAVIGLSGCGGPYQLTIQEKKTSEYGAMKFLSALGGTFASCSGQDSDRDGNVTCTGKDNASGKIYQLLCSYKGEDGCKMK